MAQAAVQSSEESTWKTYLHLGTERCINDGAMNMIRFSGGNGNSSGSCNKLKPVYAKENKYED